MKEFLLLCILVLIVQNGLYFMLISMTLDKIIRRLDGIEAQAQAKEMHEKEEI